jgi:hypothetical protein
VTDYGHTAGNEPSPSQEIPKPGSVSLPPGDFNETQPLTSNDKIELPAKGVPVSRHPTVISITPDDHSQSQSGLLSGGSSVRVEGNSRGFPSASDKVSSDLGGERWVRGAFIIGCSAPVKIDEGIEVRLRAGANGEVDFVIQ